MFERLKRSPDFTRTNIWRLKTNVKCIDIRNMLYVFILKGQYTDSNILILTRVLLNSLQQMLDIVKCLYGRYCTG